MRTIKELFDLKGQVAIITGGASGIGAQMSYALGEAGANIVLAARKIDRCVQAAEKMKAELGINTLAVQLDVSNIEDIKNLYRQVVSKFNRVDILVNNSGTTWGAPSLEYPIEAWEKIIRINLTGSWLMAQSAARIMSKQKSGRIINIGSIASFVGADPELMDAVAYQASKAGLAGLTKDLAVKWARYNITVNCLCPGWFSTKMTKSTLGEKEKEFLENIPLGRFGKEDELKAALLFLASPGAAYCTGSMLNVDGGWVVK